MEKYFILLILVIAGLYSCGSNEQPTSEEINIGLETADSTKNKTQKSLTNDPDRFIDTEFRYTNVAGKNVILQNSLPKGGGEIDGIRGYYDSMGTHYGYAIFWTRVINETDSPFDLSINFPADSFPINSSPNAYFKLFLPTDSVSVDQLPSYNYGISVLKAFLDTSFHQPSVLQRSIKPNEEFLFFTVMLLHVADNGPIRTGFFLKEQDLFYKTSIDPYDPELIPCGRIHFKK